MQQGKSEQISDVEFDIHSQESPGFYNRPSPAGMPYCFGQPLNFPTVLTPFFKFIIPS